MKPLSFRVFDFKAILDSGECSFSNDGITVLAGQNESGKTAVLSALRDFDLPVGAKPETPDFMPEDRFDADPRVAILFRFEPGELERVLAEDKRTISDLVLEWLIDDGKIRITRNLVKGTFSLDPQFDDMWSATEPPDEAEKQRKVPRVLDAISPKIDKPHTETPLGTHAAPFANPGDFAAYLRDYWPVFVYFDSFHDMIPRTVDLADLVTKPGAAAPATAVSSTPVATAPAKSKRLSQFVYDFITQSGLDLAKVNTFMGQEKTLGNYLTSCSAQVTGDFLSYWKQRVPGSETVQLQVRHQRDEDGNSQLAFYVCDGFDQYPEQRSKGFVWFLSFYLRLAAAYTRESREQERRVLLIDEPGTYLHARAQKDVLHLFEGRLAQKDQIVYSTHSPFLLPADHLHRIRIVLKADQKGTLVLDSLTHPLLRRDGFSDTLSPILMAVGVDFTGTLPHLKDKSLLVEGISDYYYLMAWKRLLRRENWDFAVFPCTGAMSVVAFASLMIGLGVRFLALLDRDSQGNSAKQKLEAELGIYPKAVLQPRNAGSIEDVFFADDFRELLKDFDQELKLEADETPSVCMRRLKINKVLLGRKYAELVFSGKLNNPSQKTLDAAQRLLDDIHSAWEGIKERGSSLDLLLVSAD